ncbi:MAG: FoF1 ATP synthase subunit gamma [Pelolinea sp.]|nr:FoF1 ATP synthase subunit gamma [Pelolinea sp.]
MAENFDKIIQRKENIESIEPLITAMRTISLSNWRSSLNRANDLRSFIFELESAYAILKDRNGSGLSTNNLKKNIVYVLGSNRGLCGIFNKGILDFFIQKELGNDSGQEIILIGARLFKLFSQAKINTTHTIDFPDIKQIQDLSTSLCSSLTEELGQTSVSVVYNKYLGANKYSTILRNIYPKEKTTRATINDPEDNVFIIDTDPQQLINTIKFFLFTADLQLCFLSSLAAESSTRFANMENAGRNVDDLIDELEITIQAHRRGKITTETQELAVSSGLLGSKQ